MRRSAFDRVTKQTRPQARAEETGAESTVMSLANVNFPFVRYADEVRGAAVTFCAGGYNQIEFVEALLQMEREKLRPHGLTLVVSHTIDEWITVLLKQNGSGQLCAAFEFMPALQKFRRFGHLDNYARHALPGG